MNRKCNSIRNQDSEINHLNGTMSEKVQLVANNIYKEFERMISHFGSDVLECLMPLIVGVLENLDELYKTKQNDDLEIELIREDNEALSSQYEKEKSLRKQTEERIFDAEFMYEEEKKGLLEQNQEIESLLRISELKLRSSNDIVARLEEKERTLRAENQKLYERYTDIFKSHGDLLQRLKRFNFSASSPPPPATRGNKLPDHANDATIDQTSTKNNQSSKCVNLYTNNNQCAHEPFQTGNKFKEETVAEIFGDDQWITDPISDSLFISSNRQHETKSFAVCSNIDDDAGTAENSIEYNNGDSDTDLMDDEFGIRNEIEALIRENQDLVDTKNALNIVKDDLINRLDSLTSENDMLREDIHQHLNRQSDQTAKITFLDQELKKCREEIRTLSELKTKTPKSDINVEQKTFSRSDMAVLLQERNHFKERLLELQDALVYTEMMRVKKQFPETMDPSKQTKGNNSSVWNLFEKLTKASTSKRQSKSGPYDNLTCSNLLSSVDKL